MPELKAKTPCLLSAKGSRASAPRIAPLYAPDAPSPPAPSATLLKMQYFAQHWIAAGASPVAVMKRKTMAEAVMEVFASSAKVWDARGTSIKLHHGSLAGDWQAVGDDMRRSIATVVAAKDLVK